MNLVKFHIDVGSCLQYNSTTLKSFMSYRRRERTLINKVMVVGQSFRTVQSITTLPHYNINTARGIKYNKELYRHFIVTDVI